MSQLDRAAEIIATYQKHGWQLQRLLLRPETRAQLAGQDESSLGGWSIEDSTIDALWFSRPSHGKREAWELRLLAEAQYALFETFEADEPEEARQEVRREMEARLRDYAVGDK
ncbi:MAG: hypothetical protein ACREBG_14515 [Pyrinomonadaceae bacterium]